MTQILQDEQLQFYMQLLKHQRLLYKLTKLRNFKTLLHVFIKLNVKISYLPIKLSSAPEMIKKVLLFY